MSPQNPTLWTHPEAKKLYDKLAAAHVRWLKANPSGQHIDINMEALLALIEQVFRITPCWDCRRASALTAIQAITEILREIEDEDTTSEEPPAHGEHVH